MEHSQCSTSTINLDCQYAADIVLCMYAEFCSNCFQTAQTMAKHAVRKNRVYVQDLIHAMRREVAHPTGSIYQMRPLLNYIFTYHRLPDRPLVPANVLNRIFRHQRGARALRINKASQDELGDWLFDCLLTGCVLCEKISKDEGREADRHYAGNEDNNDDDDEDSEGGTKTLGREFCRCPVCASVTVTQSYWSTYEPQDEMQQYLKKYCAELEERLTLVALEPARQVHLAEETTTVQ